MAEIIYLTPQAKRRLGISDDYLIALSKVEHPLHWEYYMLTLADGRNCDLHRDEIAFYREIDYFGTTENSLNSQEEYETSNYLIEGDREPEEIEETENNNDGDSSSDCFIATACEADLQTLNALRRFRDTRLLHSSCGRKFVDFYYKFSPQVAKFIQNKSILKKSILFTLILPTTLLVKKFDDNSE